MYDYLLHVYKSVFMYIQCYFLCICTVEHSPDSDGLALESKGTTCCSVASRQAEPPSLLLNLWAVPPWARPCTGLSLSPCGWKCCFHVIFSVRTQSQNLFILYSHNILSQNT